MQQVMLLWAMFFEGVQIVNGATNNTIGGTTAAHGNVITGNGDGGIQISADASDANTIQHNAIGVTADGSSAIGNGGDGIFITGGGDTINILDNHIAGNATVGIEIDGDSNNVTIQGKHYWY